MSPIYEMNTQMKMTHLYNYLLFILSTYKRKHVRILSAINVFCSVHANKPTLPALPFPNV